MSEPEAVDIFRPLRRRGECKPSAIPGQRLNRMPGPSGLGVGIRPLETGAMPAPGSRRSARGQAEVSEDPDNDRGILNGGNNFRGPPQWGSAQC